MFYCNGGECDDSEHAAIMLRDSLGIPKEKVFVYGGGIAEWTTNGLPIEVGARNSGEFTNVVKTAAAAEQGQCPAARKAAARRVEAMSELPSTGKRRPLDSSACWRGGFGRPVHLPGGEQGPPPGRISEVRAAATRGDQPDSVELITGTVPWLEVLYGLLLLTGIARDAAAVLARWWLGCVFIYMGLSKALPHPEYFLKLVRQYDMVTSPLPAELDRRRAPLVRGLLRPAAACSVWRSGELP